MRTYPLAAAMLAAALPMPALAASDREVESLRNEVSAMRGAYESRIAELETKLQKLESAETQPAAAPAPAPAASGSARDNSFNPAIGVILNGRYSTFSEKNAAMPGFGIGAEGERGKEGLALDESEINFSANADDKFAGSLTASIVSEGGEDKIELEEAFLRTLPGMGLPRGMEMKAGRALWALGYLNEHHKHADDFADRPLPYRAFLNNAFNDDGTQLSYVLPTDLFTEIGGGIYRGDDFPLARARGESAGAWSAYGRIGGDIGENQSWRLGASVLSGGANARSTNNDTVTFQGNTRLYIADLRYVWAPTGNNHEQEVTLQGEYMRRSERGLYEDTIAVTGPVDFDGHGSGWYAQGVYKFLPQWRAGARYSRLNTPYVPAGLSGSALDAAGHNPDAWAVMGDWSNSEFSRVRLQYNREAPNTGPADNQIILQYILSLGAHPAHAY